MTITEQKTIAIAEDDIRDWIEDLRYAAYRAHRSHPGGAIGLDTCGKDLCHTISSVTIAMEQRMYDRSAPEVIPDPDPPKRPAPRRPRARKNTNA